MISTSLIYIILVFLVMIGILGSKFLEQKPTAMVLESIKKAECKFLIEFTSTNLVNYIYNCRAEDPARYEDWNNILKAMRKYAQSDSLLESTYLSKDPAFQLTLHIVQHSDVPPSTESTQLLNNLAEYLRKEISLVGVRTASEVDVKLIAMNVSNHPLFDAT